ncbi:cytochrome P450 CYP82D47-like isoform X1 [Vitis riparia]|uniref:cytochrome P450 CYP82D47-like isoform X1 n=1 Tax=Vitis riparia TaxID=96939 RepID=UPI00155B3B85|nr:cytochrome P450 CYP82D47-like isoform X1 [Vitis riparia]
MAVRHSSSLLQYLNVTTIGVLGILFLSYYLLVRRSRAGKRRIAPEAAGAWPIIGHLHLLGGSQLPHVTLGTMADKYGPVFTIRLGVHRALVASSWEMAKECLTTNDQVASSRPELLASKHLGYNYAMFGFSPYGSYWREVRKIISLELLSNRRLELLKDVRASEAVTSIKELYKLWEEKKNESGLVSVEMKQWFGDLTLNVILRMVTGKRYFSASDTSENKQAQRCRRVFREFCHLSGLFAVADAIPFLGWLDLGRHEKTLKKTAKEMDSIAQEWLEEHRRRKDSGEVNSTQDFMDVMLSVLDGKNLGDYDADTINKATCLALIVGGSDTTVVTLTWALSLLLNNRDTLKKAQEELDIQVGKERLVNEQDISKLVYLQAIVKETLRLYPPAALGGPRQFTEDCTLGGYHVSKGTRLILNLSKIQKDPRIWMSPTEFQPERFLTTHKDLDPRGKHFEFIPFGAGRRACPGIAFALQMLHLTLANFLQAFNFSTPSNAQVDMCESLGLTNMKSTPLEVLISPRMSFL